MPNQINLRRFEMGIKTKKENALKGTKIEEDVIGGP
jgi:hypothetical protein